MLKHYEDQKRGVSGWGFWHLTPSKYRSYRRLFLWESFCPNMVVGCFVFIPGLGKEAPIGSFRATLLIPLLAMLLPGVCSCQKSRKLKNVWIAHCSIEQGAVAMTSVTPMFPSAVPLTFYTCSGLPGGWLHNCPSLAMSLGFPLGSVIEKLWPELRVDKEIAWSNSPAGCLSTGCVCGIASLLSLPVVTVTGLGHPPSLASPTAGLKVLPTFASLKRASSLSLSFKPDPILVMAPPSLTHLPFPFQDAFCFQWKGTSMWHFCIF